MVDMPANSRYNGCMIRGTDVNFEYEYEVELAGDPGEFETLLLDVSASITDYHSAVMYLSNGEPGYPAEGGEVEDLEVIGPDGIAWADIPEALVAKLEDMARDEAGI